MFAFADACESTHALPKGKVRFTTSEICLARKRKRKLCFRAKSSILKQIYDIISLKIKAISV